MKSAHRVPNLLEKGSCNQAPCARIVGSLLALFDVHELDLRVVVSTGHRVLGGRVEVELLEHVVGTVDCHHGLAQIVDLEGVSVVELAASEDTGALVGLDLEGRFARQLPAQGRKLGSGQVQFDIDRGLRFAV